MTRRLLEKFRRRLKRILSDFDGSGKMEDGILYTFKIALMLTKFLKFCNLFRRNNRGVERLMGYNGALRRSAI